MITPSTRSKIEEMVLETRTLLRSIESQINNLRYCRHKVSEIRTHLESLKQDSDDELSDMNSCFNKEGEIHEIKPE